MNANLKYSQSHDASARVRNLLDHAPESLPILRQSCMRVLDLTDNDRSSAQDIGDVIMRDQSLTTKILKLANSPAYGTRSAITTPTQAVIIVGIEVIRAITVAAELIEQTEKQHGNTANLKQLLARSLVAASLALELGIHIKHPDRGGLFTSAMLYSLGTLVMAYYLPDLYQQFEQARTSHPEKTRDLEYQFFGRPLAAIGASIAKQWHLPSSFIQLMESPASIPSTPLKRPHDQLAGLVRLSNELSCCLLDPVTPSQGATLNRLLKQLSSALQLSTQQIEVLAIQACQKALQFCDSVNIEKEFFLPKPPHPSLPIHPFYRTMTATLTANENSRSNQPHTPAPAPTRDAASPPADSQGSAMWKFLETFTLQALTVSDANTLLHAAAEGLYTAARFDRVILALLIPATSMLEARISFGIDPHILHLLQCPGGDHTLMVSKLQHSGPRHLSSLQEETLAGYLDADFVNRWGQSPCFLGAFSAKGKPIGLVLADRGVSFQPLTSVDYAGFVMILSQINGALSRLAQ